MKKLIAAVLVCFSFLCNATNPNVYKLKQNKPKVIKGLTVQLLKHQYTAMVGAKTVLKVTYKQRTDYITLSAGGCEAVDGFYYYWQGYTFRLKKYIIKSEQTSNTKPVEYGLERDWQEVEIIREKITLVDPIYNQDSLVKIYNNIKILMQVQEGQPGNAQVDVLKTKDRTISAYYMGCCHYNQKNEYIEITVQGGNTVCRYTLIKDTTTIIIANNAIREYAKNITTNLKWLSKKK